MENYISSKDPGRRNETEIIAQKKVTIAKTSNQSKKNQNSHFEIHLFLLNINMDIKESFIKALTFF